MPLIKSASNGGRCKSLSKGSESRLLALAREELGCDGERDDARALSMVVDSELEIEHSGSFCMGKEKAGRERLAAAEALGEVSAESKDMPSRGAMECML